MLLAVMNAAVMAIILGVAWTMDYLGAEFAYGALTGGLAVAWYLRIKLGYWP